MGLFDGDVISKSTELDLPYHYYGFLDALNLRGLGYLDNPLEDYLQEIIPIANNPVAVKELHVVSMLNQIEEGGTTLGIDIKSHPDFAVRCDRILELRKKEMENGYLFVERELIIDLSMFALTAYGYKIAKKLGLFILKERYSELKELLSGTGFSMEFTLHYEMVRSQYPIKYEPLRRYIWSTL